MSAHLIAASRQRRDEPASTTCDCGHVADGPTPEASAVAFAIHRKEVGAVRDKNKKRQPSARAVACQACQRVADVTDRTYWNVPGARSWHALLQWRAPRVPITVGLCGRTSGVLEGSGTKPEIADRLPPNAHLCGSCARSIAARTDAR